MLSRPTSGRSGHQWTKETQWPQAGAVARFRAVPIRPLSPLGPLLPLGFPPQPLDISNNRLIVHSLHLHRCRSAVIKFGDFPKRVTFALRQDRNPSGARKTKDADSELAKTKTFARRQGRVLTRGLFLFGWQHARSGNNQPI